tara:strand:+ start:228 stop:536 length:309 start_codon:yes stop_codon:yes gene_type:complete
MNKFKLIQLLNKLELAVGETVMAKKVKENINELILDVKNEAINYTHSCKSDSEQLPDVEKKQLIEDAYWLNLQNLNGREDSEEAFKLGIETGVDETLEKLQS